MVLGAEPHCNQTATLSRQSMFVPLTSSGKLVAQLVHVYMTFITFNLIAAPKLFTHVETKHPAITEKTCVGDVRLCAISIHRDASFFNSSYMTDCWIIKNEKKNRKEKKSVIV